MDQLVVDLADGQLHLRSGLEVMLAGELPQDVVADFDVSHVAPYDESCNDWRFAWMLAVAS